VQYRTRILGRLESLPLATETDEGIARVKELLEASSGQRITVEKEAQQIDAFLADTNIGRETHRFPLNITQQVDVILAVEWRPARDHFK
jgi:hypothetical protein